MKISFHVRNVLKCLMYEGVEVTRDENERIVTCRAKLNGEEFWWCIHPSYIGRLKTYERQQALIEALTECGLSEPNYDLPYTGIELTDNDDHADLWESIGSWCLNGVEPDKQRDVLLEKKLVPDDINWDVVHRFSEYSKDWVISEALAIAGELFEDWYFQEACTHVAECFDSCESYDLNEVESLLNLTSRAAMQCSLGDGVVNHLRSSFSRYYTRLGQPEELSIFLEKINESNFISPKMMFPF
ncbi:MAG: hypothetical protein RIB43_15685 [Rhodospirillaceae bacterium]